MPLLWRYLLGDYLKIFALCVGAFVAILMTMRLDEIAYFATLGPQSLHILWFALQQIPYIIPIAMPIAAIIASTLLMLRLSQAHELTAMRACGFALRDIIAPILIAACFLSLANFYIISELSTAAHHNSGKLKNELRSINPLLLLHNKHIMQVKGFYVDTLGPSRTGEFAEDIVFFSPNKRSHRLNMMIAKELRATPENFSGKNVTLLTSKYAEGDRGKENFIVENMADTNATINDFTRMLEKKMWNINNDHLRLPLLLARLSEARQELTLARASGDKAEIKQARYYLNSCCTEIIRRLSVALAVFSFTLMGLAFGIKISRNQSSRGIAIIILLASLYLIAFFGAKSFDHALIAASLLYLVPHLIIWSSSFWILHRRVHGIE